MRGGRAGVKRRRCRRKPPGRRHQWAGREICGSMFQRGGGGGVSGGVVVAAYFICNEAQSRYLPDIFK